ARRGAERPSSGRNAAAARAARHVLPPARRAAAVAAARARLEQPARLSVFAWLRTALLAGADPRVRAVARPGDRRHAGPGGRRDVRALGAGRGARGEGGAARALRA